MKNKRNKLEYLMATMILILMALGGFFILSLYNHNFHAEEHDVNHIETLALIVDSIRENDVSGRIMLIGNVLIIGEEHHSFRDFNFLYNSNTNTLVIEFENYRQYITLRNSMGVVTEVLDD
ncbi:MAG: hypothetical protein FWD82_01830 [Defluviitaleaceae bacterium]|nr:hypothetical protein [Defluviitaleaceae bacterium]